MNNRCFPVHCPIELHTFRVFRKNSYRTIPFPLMHLIFECSMQCLVWFQRKPSTIWRKYSGVYKKMFCFTSVRTAANNCPKRMSKFFDFLLCNHRRKVYQKLIRCYLYAKLEHWLAPSRLQITQYLFCLCLCHRRQEHFL